MTAFGSVGLTLPRQELLGILLSFLNRVDYVWRIIKFFNVDISKAAVTICLHVIKLVNKASVDSATRDRAVEKYLIKVGFVGVFVG